MKNLKRALCLVMVLAIMMLTFTSCDKADVFEITIDGGAGARTYVVSYDLYRAMFLYLKNFIAEVVQDAEGNKAIGGTSEQNAALKEATEEQLINFYALVACAADHGITITEEDRAAYQADYQETVQKFMDMIPDDLQYSGTKEEYAAELYAKSLKVIGVTIEYHEFVYYRALLSERLKALIAGDLEDYLNQNYTHYKQVIVVYAKGDADAEAEAAEAIENAREELLAGVDIDEVIKKYDTSDYGSEIYLDTYGYIVGSSSQSMVNTVGLNAIRALGENEISDIMSGDEDSRLSYFAVYQRLGFDIEYICSEAEIAKTIYQYPYVNASYYTPHYSRYNLLIESYKQNVSICPIDVKAYNRINIKNVS